MNSLLIDIGNSRIKWAVLRRNGALGRQRASAYEGWTAERAVELLFGKARGIQRMVAVSVAPESINQTVRAAAHARGIESVTFVDSARQLGGVTTRYLEPWRLGADRLVATVGAHAIAGKRGVCVVDVGTAMTLDVVDAKGNHLGGAIIPGPQLMVSALLKDTNGIQQRARTPSGRGTRLRSSLFARTTRDAIDNGARFATASAIDRAVLEARAVLGRAPLVLLTGGGAALVRPLLRTRSVREIPDLVLRGLAELTKTPLR